MRADADFFCLPLEQLRRERSGVGHVFHFFAFLVLLHKMRIK